KHDIPENFISLKISVSGLLGGHSGDDINKHRGNANKILNRLLMHISQKYKIHLAQFDGGNLSNAIPREAFCIIAIPSEQKDNILKILQSLSNTIKNEFLINEPGLKIQ